MTLYDIITTAVTSLLSSGIAATAISAITLKRTRQIEEAVRQDSEKNIQRFISTREKQEEMLTALIGPICMHLHRTKRAFMRYKDSNAYLEAEVLYKGNSHARDLILQKGYLLDAELLHEAVKLLEHYDAWLEEYSRQRSDPYTPGARFVFAGPKGYPFPAEAEKAFMHACRDLRMELYGQELDEAVR